MEAMLENRKFFKKMAQQIDEEEVKKCFFDLLDKKLIDIQEDNYLTLDDSIKSIFRYYKERHSMDWKSMMREYCLYLYIRQSSITLDDSGENES
jgi:hypothetical protein